MKTKIIYWLAILFFIPFSCSSSEDNGIVEPLEKIEVAAGMNLYGIIKDDAKKPIKGVVVSDGYSCVVTDDKGIYQMKRNRKARFVFYSTPADYAITVESENLNIPCFYKEIDAVVGKEFRCDFNLSKLKQPEKKFKMIWIADPQVDNEDHIARFRNETLRDMKEFIANDPSPYYSVLLGDILGTGHKLFPNMKREMGSTRVPMFATIGNHDKMATPRNPIKNDEYFGDNFGPGNYSFNRGDVHFVCLDNIFQAEDGSRYRFGITDQQIEWMRQDLSHVPKDKMLFVYYHIPFRNEQENRKAFFDLLKDFQEVHLIAGHVHTNRYWTHNDNGKPITERLLGAACGVFWRGTINKDGTPNGYSIYEFDGNKVVNAFYKSTNYDAKFQMRLFKGDTMFGNGPTFGYGLGKNVLVANIWNILKDWTIEVYEDDVKTGTMVNFDLGYDPWTIGYLAGVLGFDAEQEKGACPHLYKYTIQNPDARIKIVAKDGYGNEYIHTSDEILYDVKYAGEY